MNIMQGGKLLSEGGYGCVYYPYLDCSLEETKTNQNAFLSKVQRYNDAAKNEIKIGAIVKTIKQYRNFFAPIVDSCVVSNIKPLETKYEKCSILTKKNPTNKYLLMKLPYAGSKTFFKYFIEASNIKEMILNILSTYSYLITATKLLFEKNIVHYDLKGENIMFNTEKKVPIIIDFGLSINLKNIKNLKSLSNAFYIYAPDYYLWSPEIQYLSYIANVNQYPSKEEITEIAKNIVQNIEPLQNVCSPQFIEKYENSLSSYLLQFYNKSPMNVFNSMKNIAYTWDNYSISIMYLRILYYLNSTGFTNNDFIIFFMKLLLQNIHPVPIRRLSTNDTISIFNNYSYKKGFSQSDDYSTLFTSLLTNQKNVVSMITNDESKLNTLLKMK